VNSIQQLDQWLQQYLPDVRTGMDPSATKSGSWHLNIRLGRRYAAVEWRHDIGFGITGNRKGVYGEQSDESSVDLSSAIGRLLPILLIGARTGRRKPVRLAELRRLKKLSQSDVAGKLRKKQSAVSKVETRGGDVKVSTLMSQLRAMGGKPSIRVSFGDQDEYELQLHRER